MHLGVIGLSGFAGAIARDGAITLERVEVIAYRGERDGET